MKRAIAALLAIVPMACGARTGLPIPEPGDASVDRTDAPYSCNAGTFPLTRGQAELLLLIDRSGSMADNLDGGAKLPRKWDDLRSALAATLPEFESRILLGAMAYPRRFDGTFARTCDIKRALDVEPAADNATAVLDILSGTDPWGATPTASAVEFVGDLLTARLSREKTESIVLATDGGPNCNTALDASTCVCTRKDVDLPPCDETPTNCLDDKRTVDTIAKYAARGIPTFVIGLDTATLPDERAALEAMARAGGAGSYYSVRDPGAVTDAFRAIQRSIVECRRFIPSRPDDPSSVRVELNGAPVPRDASHTNGWDWASVDYGQIDFFGPACERLQSSGTEPVAIVPSCAGDAASR